MVLTAGSPSQADLASAPQPDRNPHPPELTQRAPPACLQGDVSRFWSDVSTISLADSPSSAGGDSSVGSITSRHVAEGGSSNVAQGASSHVEARPSSRMKYSSDSCIPLDTDSCATTGQRTGLSGANTMSTPDALRGMQRSFLEVPSPSFSSRQEQEKADKLPHSLPQSALYFSLPFSPSDRGPRPHTHALARGRSSSGDAGGEGSPSVRMPAGARMQRVTSWRDSLLSSPGSSSHSSQWKPVEGFESRGIDLSRLFVGERFAEGTFGKLYKGVYHIQPAHPNSTMAQPAHATNTSTQPVPPTSTMAQPVPVAQCQRRDVAVKIMRVPDEEPGSAENAKLRELVAKQFWQETAMLAALEHPNIVEFIGACQKPPALCVVTELVSGGSLRALLSSLSPRCLPLASALDMALDIARGMEYLHSQGVIHRDLKPDNLLLTPEHRVKVSDFGLARVEGTRGTMTNEMGTYRWMAPEIIELKPYDRKVDVFSFGVVLWELLTSEVPYAGMTSMQAAFAVCSKNLRPPMKPGFPRDLAQLMQQCWHPTPDLRPSFSEVVQRLEGIKHGETTTPRAAVLKSALPRTFPPASSLPGTDFDGLEGSQAQEEEDDVERVTDADIPEELWKALPSTKHRWVPSLSLKRLVPRPPKSAAHPIWRRTNSAQASPVGSPGQ